MNIKEIIDRISSTHMAEKKDIIAIIENNSNDEYLFESADNIRKQIYGKDVYAVYAVITIKLTGTD